LAHYLDTVVVMVDGLTKNVATAMTAHTEPMANTGVGTNVAGDGFMNLPD
jgi:hypothetical protein